MAIRKVQIKNHKVEARVQEHLPSIWKADSIATTTKQTKNPQCRAGDVA
jgi:hypothetical protein